VFKHCAYDFVVVCIFGLTMEAARAPLSPKAAGAVAKRRAAETPGLCPTKFHCKEGAKCLSVQVPFSAWVEREKLRAEGALPPNPEDVMPVMPLHGRAVHAARALTECKGWFKECGHFVCCDIPKDSTRLLTCADVHRRTCKKFGSLDVQELTKSAVEKGYIRPKKLRSGQVSLCFVQ
jgi:hypothetical protein